MVVLLAATLYSSLPPHERQNLHRQVSAQWQVRKSQFLMMMRSSNNDDHDSERMPSARQRAASPSVDDDDDNIAGPLLSMRAAAPSASSPLRQISDVSRSGVVVVNEPDAFLEHVRNEWVNAVLGPQFGIHATTTPTPAPATVHRGLATDDVTGQHTTTLTRNTALEKWGMTMSRLPVGVYVADVQGEAVRAGVRVDSVLVAINGIALLTEPTRLALERLWLYEGYWYETNVNGAAASTAAASSSGTGEEHSKRCVEPVVLTLIKDGVMYQALLLSPIWGISWAPVGNFCLVKRVHGAAAAAGVPKGGLVGCMRGSAPAGTADDDDDDDANQMKTLRTLDHTQVAQVLDTDDLSMTITFVFPPQSTRSGQYERRLLEASKSSQYQRPPAPLTTKQADGVEVKFHPIEVALGAFCQSPPLEQLLQGAAATPLMQDENSNTMQDVLEQVSAGRKISCTALRALPPQRRKNGTTTLRPISACPTLHKGEMLEHWAPLDALWYCLTMARHKFDEHLVEDFNNARSSTLTTTTTTTAHRLQALSSLLSGPRAPALVDLFLLQFISVICTPALDSNGAATTAAFQDENKEETATTGDMKKDANELTSLLLKISRRDEDFCQRLYFLLRSYISTFETRHQPNGSRNLMALLHCLELLRFAEKELSNRTTYDARIGAVHHDDVSVATGKSMASSAAATSSSQMSATMPAPSPVMGRNRSMFGFLRKKRSKLPVQTLSKNSSFARHQSTDSAASTRPLTPNTRSLTQSPSASYENMSDFMSELDSICGTIERTLQKSFRQKIADWALQPWSPSKDCALAQATADMRQTLREVQSKQQDRMLTNPVDSSELLSSVDCDECYILPSAHFPLLLTFNVSERRSADSVVGEEHLYRTSVELMAVRGLSKKLDSSFCVHGAVAGNISKSGLSEGAEHSTTHTWSRDKFLKFDTRSSWGAPQTLSLRLSRQDKEGDGPGEEIGYAWVNLSEIWAETGEVTSANCYAEVLTFESRDEEFDDQGDLARASADRLVIEMRVKTKNVAFNDEGDGNLSRKRMLLYKHGDDLRQEAFAVQFIRTCDKILQASGLDMKLLTFHCIPVGVKRGFVEWVPGSVPLSEICQATGMPVVATNDSKSSNGHDPSMLTKAGLTKFESLRRLGGQQNDSLRRLGGESSANSAPRGSAANNPIQEYLRSVAYDADAPYFIKRDVMDTYIKSCAGYSLVSYVLGVGDRHLDNLLLHQSGCFFHCDFSFILGSDPKKYLPLRVTDDMVYGMGGKNSDNFAKFLSLSSAAFLALRRPESVRVILSMVRLMEASYLPDVSENQSTEAAILGVRDRLRLDLTDDEAISFMEELIETSVANKLWLAVDAIHSLGKKF